MPAPGAVVTLNNVVIKLKVPPPRKMHCSLCAHMLTLRMTLACVENKPALYFEWLDPLMANICSVCLCVHLCCVLIQGKPCTHTVPVEGALESSVCSGLLWLHQVGQLKDLCHLLTTATFAFGDSATFNCILSAANYRVSIVQSSHSHTFFLVYIVTH